MITEDSTLTINSPCDACGGAGNFEYTKDEEYPRLHYRTCMQCSGTGVVQWKVTMGDLRAWLKENPE